MIDAMTRKPLRVLTAGTSRLYIMVPVSQLTDVRKLLDEHNVRYSVNEYSISLDGAPATTMVDFARGTDVGAIQSILDGVD